MKQELEEQLCTKYPKLFSYRVNRNTNSPLAFGLECGDGWFTIIDTMCRLIQTHIDWERERIASTKRFNRILAQARKGNERNLRYYAKSKLGYKTEEQIDEYVKNAKPREISETEPPKQVQFFQIKEKFASLCVYTGGSDEYVNGIIRMAEAISGCTCEDCGLPGKRRQGGWIRTLCDSCSERRGKK
jgi:hypothetical protein